MTEKISLETAKKKIAEGAVLIMPTDTAFGVACDVNNPEAVERIFRIKQREADKAFPIHIGEVNMLSRWIEKIPEKAQKLINNFWPGDLTIVFETYRFVQYVTKLTDNIETVAIRFPDHQSPIELSKFLGNAIVGTSANFHEKKEAYKPEDLDPDFVKLTDGIIGGECGGKPASTVVGFVGDKFEVYREGRITTEMIENVLDRK